MFNGIKSYLVFLIIFSLIFPQKTYEFSEEEVKSLYTSIKELENTDSTNQKIIENLNEQIYMYIQQSEIDSQMIANYIEQLKLKDDLIKEIKPKWHENKYLWFFGGVIVTSGSVFLAGQIK